MKKATQARLRGFLGTGLGFLTTGKRGAGVLALPLDQPGDFPRTLGTWAGVPKVARIAVMARRTCRGVTGRVLLSHGRRTAATKGRANTYSFSTAATNRIQRSNCSGVRKGGWSHSRSCF